MYSIIQVTMYNRYVQYHTGTMYNRYVQYHTGDYAQ